MRSGLTLVWKVSHQNNVRKFAMLYETCIFITFIEGIALKEDMDSASGTIFHKQPVTSYTNLSISEILTVAHMD